MALQTSVGILPCRMELMDAVFGDLSLNVGKNSLLTFPLRLEMVRQHLFGTTSGPGRPFERFVP